MATVVNVILDNGTTTVNVVMTGGILFEASSLPVIDGFIVQKGSGNVAPTIEIGDYLSGWLSVAPSDEIYINARSLINGTPTTISEVAPAVQGEIFS